MHAAVDLKRLKLFRQVVECGGLSAAEAVLNINLPTISAHLAALEASLGMRLCERGRKGFRVTAQGQTVLMACERLFESVESFRSEISEVSQRVSGSLRLGLVDNTISDPRCPVITALRALRGRGRDLEINIEVRNPFELERALLEERIDIAVGPFHTTDPGVEQFPLHKETLSLFLGQGHALFGKTQLRLQDLAGADCVMRGYLRESQVVQQQVSFNYCATAQNLEGIANLILTGCYVGYLPEHYAAPWLQAKRMQRILPKFMTYEVQFKAMALKQKRRSRAAQALLELLQSGAST